MGSELLKWARWAGLCVALAAGGCDSGEDAAALDGGAAGGGGGGADGGGAGADGAPAPVEPPYFANPQAVRFVGDRLVVSNVNFDPQTFELGDGWLTVLDPESGEVHNKIATTQANPGQMVVHGADLYVVNTGKYDYSDPAQPRIAAPGGLDVFPVATLDEAVAPAANVEIAAAADNASLGGPVDLAFVGDRGVVALGIANAALLFDAAGAALLRDTADPIRYDGADWRLGLGSVAADASRVYLADFNVDRLFVIDGTTGEAWPCWIELGEAPADLEGPQSVAVDGDDLYAVLALAGVVRHVDLGALGDGAGAAPGPCPGAAAETVVAPLGETPNHLVVTDDALWVTQSGDNNVRAFDRTTGAARDTWALDPDTNPWQAAVSPDGRWLAVTEWATHAVSIWDLEAGGPPRRVEAQ